MFLKRLRIKPKTLIFSFNIFPKYLDNRPGPTSPPRTTTDPPLIHNSDDDEPDELNRPRPQGFNQQGMHAIFS